MALLLLLLTTSLLGLSLLISVVEMLTYPGAIMTRLPFLSHYLVLGLAAIFAFLSYKKDVIKNSKINEVMTQLIPVFLGGFVLAMIGYSLFQVLEKLTYPNFVLSTFRVHHQPLQAVGIALAGFGFYYTILQREEFSIQKIGVLIALTLFLSQNIPGVAVAAAHKLTLPLSNPQASYDQKMEHSLGWFYTYMQFVASSTQADAIIELPTQGNPWIYSSNAGLVRYFLYPRYLSNNLTTVPGNKKVTHYLLLRSELNNNNTPETLWPSEPIPAKRIILIDPETLEVSEIENVKVFDPKDFENTSEWGIIEL